MPLANRHRHATDRFGEYLFGRSMIFGLNCDEKLEFCLAQIFVIWGK